MSAEFNDSDNERFDSASNIAPPSSGTVMFWLYARSVTGNRRISGGETTFECRLNGASMLHEFFSNNATNPTGQTATINTWEHWAFTWNGTNKSVYRNGVQVYSATNTHGSPVTGIFCIGTSQHDLGGTNYFYGAIDDYRVYNSAVSASIIQSIHAAKGGDSVRTSLIHQWLMRGGAFGAVMTNQVDHAGSVTMNVVGNPNYGELISNGRRR